MPNFSQARQNMICCQLKTWGILDSALLNLMSHTQREKFVPKAYEHLAYADTELPILQDQKMLPPKTLARAIQALEIKPTDHILEIGSGSGYSTLLLSRLAHKLTSIEIRPELFALTKKNLEAFAPHNIELILANGALGHPDNPDKVFDKILITASYAECIPAALIHQLNLGGKLFAFVGNAPVQQGILLSKLQNNTVIQESLFETMVMPLIDAPIDPRFHF